MARIVIVGAGIVGLSAARAARAHGHDVVLIERGSVPNPRAASWDSHRMIRDHYADAAGYTRMVDRAFAAWEGVWSDIGAVHHHASGAIAIGVAPGDYAHRTLATFRALGIEHELLDAAALAAMCPQYRLPAGAFGVLTRRGGPLFADRIVTALAAHVVAAGVEVMADTEVVGIDVDAGTVTLADGTVATGDALVVAAGAWVGRILPDLAAIPVMRQALVYVTPPAAVADAWRDGPALAAFGAHGGYTLPGVVGTDLKFGNGPHRRRADPEVDGFDSPPGEAAEVIAAFGDILHDIGGYQPLRVAVGYYVMDDSRRFRIEPRGRALVVTNCDGQMFKFGPVVGEQLVAAIEGRVSASDLSAWASGA